MLKIALKTHLCIGIYRNTKFSQGLKYVNLSFSNNDLNSNKAKALRDSKGYIRQSGATDYFPGGIDSSNTEATLISTSPAGGNYQTKIHTLKSNHTLEFLLKIYSSIYMYIDYIFGEDNLVLSNNSVQPAWRSNYKMDYKGPLRNVTTTDLICWSFQVARGMDYLASRKVFLLFISFACRLFFFI